jgi:SOS-response transcriptional repressor LexA
LTLLDEDGKSVAADTDYWVELHLCGEDDTGNAHELRIRRHSSHGLSKSQDGTSWERISSIDSAGISELDAELHIIMPARVPHLRFGESPDIVQLFSKIIGLDDLETISLIAGKTATAMKTEATKLEKGELKAEGRRIDDAVGKIKSAATEEIRSWLAYEVVNGTTRTFEGVEEFGNEVKEALTRSQEQMLHDIGLDVPPQDDPKYKDVQKQLAGLSGRVELAVERLEKPLKDIFNTSLGVNLPDEEASASQAVSLDGFEQQVREQIHGRLSWALQEDEDAKAKLMLLAARHFSEDDSECPVCTQDLESVPEIRTRLEQLAPLSLQPHLEKEIADFERELRAQLDEIVSSQLRKEAEHSLSERLKADWERLKQDCFTGLLSAVAERCVDEIAALAESLQVETLPDIEILSGEHTQQFSKAFVTLCDALKMARRYLLLSTTFHQHSDRIRNILSELLVLPNESKQESLYVILKRGSHANQQIQALESVYEGTRALWKAQKKSEELQRQIHRKREIAEWMVAFKSLGQLVRAKTIRLIEDVEPRMKIHFESLYDNEILRFKDLTTGHAANPDVKNQVNVYLLAGGLRIPMGPFSNAGRTRALLLSFVFALLERSSGTLGLLILDDPALSLDDEHKARFIDKLVVPNLDTKQVIVATHYEDFFDVAAKTFTPARHLQLPPRRTAKDEVSFEATDLLQRLEESLSKSDASWREFGGNLRKWAERTLRTISGYCPVPFYIFDKLSHNIDAYAAVDDSRVATANRNRIITALRSPEFKRVMHRHHHAETLTESETRDGLRVLKGCRKIAEQEIDHFKKLYNHATLGRAIEARATVEVLSFKSHLPDKELKIKAHAAAAAGGVGVNWLEDETVMLREYQAVRVTTDVLAPVALAGQVVLLDPDDSPPNESDLVVVETDDGKYVRRYWLHDHVPYLENLNPNTPCPPVLVAGGACKMRRIVGVLFDDQQLPPEAAVAGEWTPVGNGSRRLLANLFGIRVHGTSMEPIARDTQIVFAHPDDASGTLRNGELACVDAEDTDAVIKRCKPGDQQWVLTAVNPTAIEDPIVIDTKNIRHVYRLAGVLFELPSQ